MNRTGAFRYAAPMRQTGDQPDDILRLSVPKAAEALGISPEAVRNRLSRDTLQSERHQGVSTS